MRFFSDNAAPVCRQVLDALAGANQLDTAYDGDRWSAQLDGAFSELFEAPVRALWVPTGTAANCLALAALCPPDGGVVCHRDAHVQVDEAGAPGFYTHGATLMLGEGPGAKLTPDAIRAVVSGIRPDVHQVQPHAVTITNATEYGLAYSPAEVGAIGELCRERGWGLHMDGARFANAVAHLGCSPAEVTWKAGVDVLSFGFVKNGGMSAEALVFFRTELAEATLRRRKRAGLLFSKGRYLAAQLLAMLKDDLWLANARNANAGAKLLAEAAGERLVFPAQANEVFIRVSAEEAAGLRALGFDFYDWTVGEARLVTSWDQDPQAIRPLAQAIAALP
ncbi:beta-eliminating lyase-related protein [Sphingomonas sp.]|uniref:threonine aldolase family protein n=1 Tax=Sphingomonas sp. TaxID=28214 RepID=UPI001B2C86E7|nr:beta-eliminating lyase-related protein [Sphingomonas sp.]MBO9713028.1 low specificity L-threonine aldolase [Sphingomonas sp.]